MLILFRLYAAKFSRLADKTSCVFSAGEQLWNRKSFPSKQKNVLDLIKRETEETRTNKELEN